VGLPFSSFRNHSEDIPIHHIAEVGLAHLGTTKFDNNYQIVDLGCILQLEGGLSDSIGNSATDIMVALHTHLADLETGLNSSIAAGSLDSNYWGYYSIGNSCCCYCCCTWVSFDLKLKKMETQLKHKKERGLSIFKQQI
jgi:hypothetical protein